MKKLKNLYQYLRKKKFLEDKKAKSLSFFYKEKIKFPILDKNLLDVMSEISNLGKIDLRLNLHSSVKKKHHDMVILQRKSSKRFIHKHLSQGETIHIMKGSITILLFNKKKKLIKKIILNKKNKLICRIPTNLNHCVQIKSPYAIYHETKKGPFIKKETILA